MMDKVKKKVSVNFNHVLFSPLSTHDAGCSLAVHALVQSDLAWFMVHEFRMTPHI